MIDYADKTFLKRKVPIKNKIGEWFSNTRIGCFVRYKRKGFTVRAAFWMALNRL